jgi:hypothetical protein
MTAQVSWNRINGVSRKIFSTDLILCNWLEKSVWIEETLLPVSMWPTYALSSNHDSRSGSPLINKYLKYFYYENYDYK